LDETGAAVTVPEYRHAVGLDFVRYELVTSYSFTESWDAWLRVPYDRKDRSATVEPVESATDDEIDDMQRQLDLHHPARTLSGFSDFSLLFARMKQNTLRDGDTFVVAFGTSIPVGRIEDNPFELGDAGLPHEHIQFGTGTFDPLLEVHYSTPISDRMTASANALAKFPLYENRKGYRGPGEFSFNLGLMLRPTDRFSLRAGFSSIYQSHAHWDGVVDTNSGLVSHAAVGGASYSASDDVLVSFDLLIPVYQRTLSEAGDTFEQGTIVQVGLSYSF
jgi:hypothetical protein